MMPAEASTHMLKSTNIRPIKFRDFRFTLCPPIVFLREKDERSNAEGKHGFDHEYNYLDL
jgi:hypothetical protein